MFDWIITGYKLRFQNPCFSSVVAVSVGFCYFVFGLQLLFESTIYFLTLLYRSMSSQVSSQVEAALKRIQSHKGVVGTIVVNSEGIPLRTDLDNSNTLLHASLCKALVSMANNTVRDIDPENELTILRVKSKKNELIISPWDDYLLIVIQNNNEWMTETTW